jgi:hypothetical protein
VTVDDVDLFGAWLLELARPDPDPAVIAALEADSAGRGLSFTAALGALTAARGFNADLHPRGKDGKFIEKFGLVELFDLPNMPEGQRGKVSDIRPNKSTPGRPDVHVQLMDRKTGKPGKTVKVKPNNIGAAPEKARLDGFGKPARKNQAAPDVSRLTDDDVIDRIDEPGMIDEYNRRFPAPDAPTAKPSGRVAEVARQIEADNPGVTVELSSPAEDLWRLSAIKVAQGNRGKGSAGRALDDLLEAADDEGVSVSLSPESFGSDEGGMSNTQLRDWYSRRGFEPNTGPSRRQDTTDSMVRTPETPEAKAFRQERRQAGNEARGLPDQELDRRAQAPETSEAWRQAIDTERQNRAARRLQDEARRQALIDDVNTQAAKLSTTDPEARAQGLDEILAKLRFSIIDTDKVHDHIYPPGESGRWTPERAAQHEEMWDELLASVDQAGIPKDKDAFVLGGLPGAGKSYSLRPGQKADRFGVKAWETNAPTMDDATHVSINPDIVKEMLIARGMLPEGLSDDLKPMEKVTFLHEESSYLAKLFSKRLGDEGYNIVLDNTMDSEGGMLKRMTPLARQGYTFRGLFVDIPIDESRASAKKRYIDGALTPQGGRFVPSSVQGNRQSSQGNMSKNRDAMDTLVAKDWFKDWMVVDNTGVINRTPKSEITAEGKGGGTAAGAYLPQNDDKKKGPWQGPRLPTPPPTIDVNVPVPPPAAPAAPSAPAAPAV